jgi:hypothetical protein
MNRNLMVVAIAAMTFTLAACSNANGSSSGDSSGSNNAVVSGPAGYHTQYANIQHTNVTLQNFDIRTEEGDVIHVDTAPMTVDLQSLAGFAQGLNLDLTNVDFPGGAQTINVAEIQTNVVSGSNANIQSSDGTTCKLSSLPKTLNLYTAAAIPLGHDLYHVKVSFTALNSIQLNEITITKKVCTPITSSHGTSSANFTSTHHSGHDGDHDDDDHDKRKCCPNGTTNVESLTKECKIVNRRQLVPAIPRAADDEF